MMQQLNNSNFNSNCKQQRRRYTHSSGTSDVAAAPVGGVSSGGVDGKTQEDYRIVAERLLRMLGGPDFDGSGRCDSLSPSSTEDGVGSKYDLNTGGNRHVFNSKSGNVIENYQDGVWSDQINFGRTTTTIN
eukprot:Trichotokara_eunicae@DN11114_c0_g1_i1.p1